MEDNRLAFTVREFSKLSRISLPVLYDLIHAGSLPVLKVGRKYLVPRAAAERWLAENVGSQVYGEGV